MSTSPISDLEWRTIHVPLTQSRAIFDFEKAVCSHGFFMMAPNSWGPSTKIFQRPFRLLSDPSTSFVVRIHQPSHFVVHIQISATLVLSSGDENCLLGQVIRMLKISETDENDVSSFHSKHQEAKNNRFGRIFRSPTLFEDVIKSVLLTNCGWERSLQMAESLCAFQWKLKGVNHIPKSSFSSGDFPTSTELLNNASLLKVQCKLGTRAQRIIDIAVAVENGELQFINKIGQDEALDIKTIETKLMNIKGIGPFTCNFVLICMGHYRRIPVDSETVGHIKEIHRKENCTRGNGTTYVDEIYKQYDPYQFLAYWFELWGYYEDRFGKMNELDPSSYKIVTGSPHREKTKSPKTKPRKAQQKKWRKPRCQKDLHF